MNFLYTSTGALLIQVPYQMIWFLAPTVSLCDQQFGVIKTQIPSVLPKIVTGSDKVDSWSISTWEGVLVNVKVVITTHQVLLDALLHGFVQISSLALIIFDEGNTISISFRYSVADTLPSTQLYQEAPGQQDHERILPRSQG